MGCVKSLQQIGQLFHLSHRLAECIHVKRLQQYSVGATGEKVFNVRGETCIIERRE